ncbi:DUF7503 family protein [Halorussus caseinilyticus]|uniref:Uncharacterized protein n=1 Tax=Halorussus caseinilyticus TaxID=3034025 RepID=A0ABD5WML4_9EURY|nr:hypothetical protein [Halorussus sp. DT72]
MSRNQAIEALSERPRLVGALFTASILLMNVGNVLAVGGGGKAGP